jgi:hypothetical protein
VKTERWHRRVLLAAAVGAALLVAACTSNETAGTRSTTPTTVAAVYPPTRDCELFDAGHCLFPFPSNTFTRPDPSTPTGRRVAFARSAMPVNTSGVAIDPTEWNRNDGFSPGGPIVLYVRDLDLAVTGAPALTDLARSLASDSPIVIVDAETGDRHPFWAELDANAPPGQGALLIRPAVNFQEGHRYVVALRNLRRADGSTIDPSPAFAALRDGTASTDSAVEDRRPAMDAVLATLEAAGVGRDDLYLAWDFTVASTQNLTGRVLAMRDAAVPPGDTTSPPFTVTAVTPGEPGSGVLRVVEGSVQVPNFLTDGGAPGSVLNNGDNPDGVPTVDGTLDAPFVCVIPTTAEQAETIDVLYGHGLLGSRFEGRGVGEAVGDELNAVVCATDWIGMAAQDVGPIAGMLSDLSGFRMIPDRLQQAMVNVLALGRAMQSPGGLRTDPAFQRSDGSPLLGRDLAYVGNSQGGIIGGALSAVASDWDTVFLGVPGMNYSTLLQRSIDFDDFAPLFNAPYPDPLVQQLNFALVQMLWDRGENNGYAAHLTADPLPGSPAKKVLVFAAFGDHQVTNWATDVMSRTMGLRLRAPGLADGRSPANPPFWGIETIDSFPYAGSAYVMWDFGTPAPPVANVPNRAGKDPHGQGRDDPAVLRMVSHFLTTGELIDVCETGRPCRSVP